MARYVCKYRARPDRAERVCRDLQTWEEERGQTRDPWRLVQAKIEALRRTGEYEITVELGEVE